MPITVASFPAARVFSEKVREHFLRHASVEPFGGPPGVLVPDDDAINAVVDAAFWASLRREEGYTPKLSLALLPPSEAAQPLLFERPLPLDASTLSRVAPAVERPGIHLGLWSGAGGLQVWGTTRAIPMRCLVVETVVPGVLVAKHRRADESAKFVNLVVLDGDQVKVVDQRASHRPECPAVLTSLLGADPPDPWGDAADVLVELAVSMRAHARGGLLLVVPAGDDAWRESIVQPVPYAVQPPFSELAHLVDEDPEERHSVRWQEAFDRAVEGIAGLTAVDGATVVSDRYDVLSFGAKIGRRDGAPRVERVMATEPIEGGEALVVQPSELGGTRHLAAAQFIQDQPRSMALVASQDGRFTVFTWSPREGMVHAHRVETLLL